MRQCPSRRVQWDANGSGTDDRIGEIPRSAKLAIPMFPPSYRRHDYCGYKTPMVHLDGNLQTRSALPRARLLIVEDAEDSRDMLRFLLECNGYSVATAADGYG